jgi:hypothetical protein
MDALNKNQKTLLDYAIQDANLHLNLMVLCYAGNNMMNLKEIQEVATQSLQSPKRLIQILELFPIYVNQEKIKTDYSAILLAAKDTLVLVLYAGNNVEVVMLISV